MEQTNEASGLNYWRFQANPSLYNFEKSISSNVLTTWSVRKHKDNIKVGDKIILWLTGSQAGCYALAEVTKEPYDSTGMSFPDDSLWVGETLPREGFVADIKITHNLLYNPILKKDIENHTILKNIQSLQGTNFTLSKEEYEAILQMLKEPTMKDLMYCYKKYIKHTKLDDEVYKWKLLGKYQGKLQEYLLSENFEQDISNIKYENLLYYQATNVMKTLAKEKTKEYKRCILELFNEDTPLLERIDSFKKNVSEIHTELTKDKNLGSHHDERTIGVFLTYFNPNKYTFYKDDFYKKYCNFLGVNTEKAGKKYYHYLQLVDKFIDEFVKRDIELQKVVDGFLPEGSFQDKNRKILAQTILYELFGKDVLKNIFITDIKNIVTTQKNMKLNQILFGAPGTGKTYHTVNEAISIVNPDFDLLQERAVIKTEFDRLVGEGQIQFVTFHQSFSYEDFVEGIKPVMNNGQVSYEIQDGIFKRASVEAKYELYKLYKNTQKINNPKQTTQKIAFDDLWLEFIQKIQNGYSFKTISDGQINLIQVNKGVNLVVKPEGAILSYSVSKDRMEKVFNTFGNINDIKNVVEDIKKVIGGANHTAYWAVFSELKVFEKTFLVQNTFVETEEDKEEAVTDYFTKKALITDFNFQEVSQEVYNKAKKYVLIIDEINRGNVAQIFGELITLIEESKRAGKDEAIELVLPYSKDTFSVPANLYLIGTMNTADRSVEALDTALRRRFSFKEMRPDYTLLPTVEGVEVGKMLQTINARIELLLDKDHAIGHSYFLGLETIEDLRLAFENKLIPLLQEYFFGDFSKIGLVLGESFVALQKPAKDGFFAPFASVDKNLRNDLLRREVYHFTDKETWDSPAFQRIYS